MRRRSYRGRARHIRRGRHIRKIYNSRGGIRL